MKSLKLGLQLNRQQPSLSYKPLINYRWSTSIDGNNNRVLRNFGKFENDAFLYFGRGVKFNGTDQTFTIPINDTINTITYFENGSLVVDETVRTLDDYVSDVNKDSVFQNYIFYKGVFTDEQKEYLEKYPEKFLYSVSTTQSDGSKTYALQSEILTQDELDSVVAYLPMCETDKYVRNMVGYSEGVDTFDVTSYTLAGTQDEDNYVNIDDDGVIHLKHTDAIAAVYFDMDIIEGEKYLLDVEVISGDGSVKSDHFNTGQRFVNGLQCMTATSTRSTFNIYRGTSPSDIYLKIKSIRKLTSTHQIENFTNSVRDEAMNLTYGLQTCFWKRDVLGVPYAGSFDRLECDGVGYVDTGWVPDATKDFQFEVIVTPNQSKLQVFWGIWNSPDADSRFSIGTEVNGNTRIDIGSVNKYITDTLIHHILIQYNSIAKTFDIYSDGVIYHSTIDTDFITPVGNTFLISKAYNLRCSEEPIRLFKIHTTPQDPVQLYNEAVRKGLLDA